MKNELPKGLYLKKPGYEWITATLSINKKEFIDWLINQSEDTVHIQILTSKAGKMYPKKWTYENKPKLQSEDPVIKNNLENDEDFWNE